LETDDLSAQAGNHGPPGAEAVAGPKAASASLASLVKPTRAVGMAFDPRVIEAQKQATYLKNYGPNLRHGVEPKAAVHASKYRT
jgi:hypothetical protein